MIDIWYIDQSKFITFVDQFKCILSDDEKNRAQRFYFKKDADAFIISHAAKRLILATYSRIPPKMIHIEKHRNNKPYLTQESLYFNLSHSKNMTVIAVSCEAEIGVDIEYLKPITNMLSIAKRFFHEKEYEAILTLNNSEAQKDYFYTIWTAKEAVLKATGEGLSAGLNQFYINTTPLSHSLNYPMFLSNLECPNNYKSAIAMMGEKREIHYKDFTLLT